MSKEKAPGPVHRLIRAIGLVRKSDVLKLETLLDVYKAKAQGEKEVTEYWTARFADVTETLDWYRRGWLPTADGRWTNEFECVRGAARTWRNMNAAHQKGVYGRVLYPHRLEDADERKVDGIEHKYAGFTQKVDLVTKFKYRYTDLKVGALEEVPEEKSDDHAT